MRPAHASDHAWLAFSILVGSILAAFVIGGASILGVW